MKGKLGTILTVVVIVSLGLAACGPTPTNTPTPLPPTDTPTPVPPTDTPTPVPQTDTPTPVPSTDTPTPVPPTDTPTPVPPTDTPTPVPPTDTPTPVPPTPTPLPPTDTPTPVSTPTPTFVLGPCCQPLQPGKGMIWFENHRGWTASVDVGSNHYEIPGKSFEAGRFGAPGCFCLQLDPGHYTVIEVGGRSSGHFSYEIDMVAEQTWHWIITFMAPEPQLISN